MEPLEHVIFVTLHHPEFPPITVAPYNFLGTRKQAIEHAKGTGRFKSEDLGAKSFSFEVVS